jgi:hypothetical protein
MRSFLTRVVVVIAAAFVVSGAMGCATVIKPTRPDEPLPKGARVEGVRFDGQSVSLREPGVPLSPSRAWQREVASFTATQLNVAIDASDDAPVARTVVTFDLASPSVIQIGPWKTIDITVTTTLPDGNVVKTGPVEGRIDDGLESALMMGLSGTVFVVDAAGAIITIATLFFLNQSPLVMFSVMAGTIVGTMALHGAEKGGEVLVAASEETRWSNLYVGILQQHADAVRAAVANGPPRAPTTSPQQAPTDPLGPEPKPAGPAPPPPPALLDPAETAP